MKKKQTEQAGEEKREKPKGKAMELSSAGRQAKKGPEEPEEQTNNQNREKVSKCLTYLSRIEQMLGG